MSTAARFALGVLVAAAIVVIGFQIRENSERPVAVGPTGPSGVTGVLLVPPATPLPMHDSGPKRTGAPKDARSSSSESRSRSDRQSRTPAPYTPRSRPDRRNPARTRPDPRKPGNAPYTPPSGGGQPQPPPQEPRPPVDLRVPAPVTGCVRPVGGVNC